MWMCCCLEQICSLNNSLLPSTYHIPDIFPQKWKKQQVLSENELHPTQALRMFVSIRHMMINHCILVIHRVSAKPYMVVPPSYVHWFQDPINNRCFHNESGCEYLLCGGPTLIQSIFWEQLPNHFDVACVYIYIYTYIYIYCSWS